MILNKSLKSDDDSRTRDSPQKDWQQNKTLLEYATQYWAWNWILPQWGQGLAPSIRIYIYMYGLDGLLNICFTNCRTASHVASLGQSSACAPWCLTRKETQGACYGHKQHTIYIRHHKTVIRPRLCCIVMCLKEHRWCICLEVLVCTAFHCMYMISRARTQTHNHIQKTPHIWNTMFNTGMYCNIPGPPGQLRFCFILKPCFVVLPTQPAAGRTALRATPQIATTRGDEVIKFGKQLGGTRETWLFEWENMAFARIRPRNWKKQQEKGEKGINDHWSWFHSVVSCSFYLLPISFLRYCSVSQWTPSDRCRLKELEIRTTEKAGFWSGHCMTSEDGGSGIALYDLSIHYVDFVCVRKDGKMRKDGLSQ